MRALANRELISVGSFVCSKIIGIIPSSTTSVEASLLRREINNDRQVSKSFELLTSEFQAHSWPRLHYLTSRQCQRQGGLISPIYFYILHAHVQLEQSLPSLELMMK